MSRFTKFPSQALAPWHDFLPRGFSMTGPSRFAARLAFPAPGNPSRRGKNPISEEFPSRRINRQFGCNTGFTHNGKVFV